MTNITAPRFKNENAARKHLEAIRWPDGAICPHCGCTDRAHRIKGGRAGLWFCGECRKQFTVTVGTLFERSHITLHKWLLATHLMCASKKGISAHQLHRMLDVTYKTAWFMSHRIREAMRSGDLAPMGGKGSVVEVDETFIGHDKAKKPRGVKKGRGYHHKHKVFALVDRDTGKARSMVVDNLRAKTLVPLLRENIAAETKVVTDDAAYYKNLNRDFPHEFVSHSKGEYGRGEVHTNTIEGYFSIFKRGMKGTYQHCGKQHLHRYLAEFDFRYNARDIEDYQRAAQALKGIEGRRLTYRRTGAG